MNRSQNIVFNFQNRSQNIVFNFHNTHVCVCTFVGEGRQAQLSVLGFISVCLHERRWQLTMISALQFMKMGGMWMLPGRSAICVIFPVTDASWIVGGEDTCHSTGGRLKALPPICQRTSSSLHSPVFSDPPSPTSASPLLPLSQVITLTVNAQKFLCDTLKAHYCFGHTSRNTVKA